MHWHADCNTNNNYAHLNLIIMNAVIHDSMNLITTILAVICILGIIALVNFTFSRDKIVTRTMRHNNH